MIGTELDGRYRIEAELGSGGAGTVYRALQLDRQVAVAVKVLRPELASSTELRQRFAREARALTALSHPNIVAVVDSGVASDTAYLVMELLEGEALSARLRRGALPLVEALGVMRQLLSALAFVHERGLVHRDVKPANIFLQADPAGVRVRLLDFGLAKFLAPEAGGASLTRAGQVFGTPSYMAPEQIAGQQADPRTDVYAAGIVLFELLSGRVPFTGDAAEVLRRHIMDDLPLETALPKDVPVGVVNLVRVAAAKTRQGRFADAREMLLELERVAPPAQATSRVVATRPDAFAPTLSLERSLPVTSETARLPSRSERGSALDEGLTVKEPAPDQMARPEKAAPAAEGQAAPLAPVERGAPLLESRSAAPGTAPEPRQSRSLLQRLMRFGATVAILVSLGALGIAALAIYVLVTPGREQERKAIEDALGLPSANGSAAPFHPGTLHSMKAWPSASERAVETPPRNGIREEEAAQEAAREHPATPSERAEPAASALALPSPEAAPRPDVEGAVPPARPKTAEGRPTGSPPENPWASTPGELLRIMGRANRTKGFDKRDMRELHQYNGKHPSDPRGHLLLARGYLTRRWVKDAANEYAIALTISDSARGDPRLLSDLLRLVELGSDEASRLLVDVFGTAALPAVDHAMQSQARPDVKVRLARLRDELGK